jgi:hypothetical protein
LESRGDDLATKTGSAFEKKEGDAEMTSVASILGTDPLASTPAAFKAMLRMDEESCVKQGCMGCDATFEKATPLWSSSYGERNITSRELFDPVNQLRPFRTPNGKNATLLQSFSICRIFLPYLKALLFYDIPKVCMRH